MWYTTVIVFIHLAILAVAAPEKDRISSLPNFPGTLLSPMYSGYISLPQTTKSMHYWFIQSLNNPTTDPVVLWLNGGPGCSSMDGLFYEMGPIHFVAGNEVSPVLKWNPFSWVNISSMIFLESPVGVGFSYSSNGNDYNTNDTQTAMDNYAFLLNWIINFPEFSKNDFWIAGESYGGVYVPTLANLVLTGSQSGAFSMNFKGILVGNGVTPGSPTRTPIQELEFNYGHGMYSDIDQNLLISACSTDPNSQKCQNQINEIVSHFENTPINWYNIYSECASQRPLNAAEFCSVHLRQFFAQKKAEGTPIESVPPCIDANAATSYLNTATVQTAIHVNPSIKWTICSDSINYNGDVSDVIAIYRRLFQANKKVLIYNGDVDAVVDYTYSEWWTSNIGLTPTRSWQPWGYSDALGDQNAGWVTDYKEGLTFATVRGAGHMVPQYRPAAGYVMFSRFISGKPL